MTNLLAHTDAYLQEFDATIMAVDPATNAVALDRTAFYPTGGGQPHDLGWLNDFLVTKVQRQSEQVWHSINGNAPAVGTAVHGKIDWDRRHKLMRTHTAFHILCGVVWRDYGAQVTGGNMDVLQGRMDFEFASLQQELAKEIEDKCNAEIAVARNVRVKILPRAEAFQIPDLIHTKINLLPEGIMEVRIVEIEGLDLQADGGTHVANTREIGRMKIVGYESKGKINKRIRLAIE
jgi:misacylated tRNA(Ala) deacylase